MGELFKMPLVLVSGVGTRNHVLDIYISSDIPWGRIFFWGGELCPLTSIALTQCSNNGSMYLCSVGKPENVLFGNISLDTSVMQC